MCHKTHHYLPTSIHGNGSSKELKQLTHNQYFESGTMSSTFIYRSYLLLADWTFAVPRFSMSQALEYRPIGKTAFLPLYPFSVYTSQEEGPGYQIRKVTLIPTNISLHPHISIPIFTLGQYLYLWTCYILGDVQRQLMQSMKYGRHTRAVSLIENSPKLSADSTFEIWFCLLTSWIDSRTL